MDQNKIPSGLNFVAGIWILLSPWLLSFSGIGSATTNNVILGIAILLLAAARAWWGAGQNASWVNLILGIWMIVSPWALGFSGIATPTGNNVIFGIVVGILALWAIYGTPQARHGATFQSAEPDEWERRRPH